MNRRSFLKSFLAAAAPFAFPLPKYSRALASQKGFSANVVSPISIDKITGASLFLWQLGHWMFDYSVRYTPKFVICAYDVEDGLTFDAATLAQAVAHPDFSGYVAIHREPDLWLPVVEAQDIAKAQLAICKQVNPNINVILSVGTPQNPVWKDNSYGKQLLAGIPDKSMISHWGTTYYPYNGTMGFEKYMKNLSEWRSGRKIAVLEWGTITGQPTTRFDFPFVRATLDQYADMDFRYALQARGEPAIHYDCLLGADGNRTNVPF